METIEPFAALEDIWKPSSHSVSLKDGVDIGQLKRGEGTEFEVQPPDVADCEDSSAKCDRGSQDRGFDPEDLMKYIITDCIDVGSESDTEGNADLGPFDRMALKMKDLTNGDGGVLKKVLRPGVGAGPPEGAVVRVHYNGYLEYSEEPYDSSRLRNEQQQFTLGRGEVIFGWEVAVQSMRRSELSQFLIRADYGFGDMGCPPRIPPGATIMFEIELISFVDHKAADDFYALPREEREQITLKQLIAVAEAEREAGNDFFYQKAYSKASGKYKRAVRLLESARLKNEEEEQQWKAVLLKLYLNLSLCSLRLRRPKLAISQCNRSLELDKSSVKGHFRLGQAYLQLSEFKKSRESLIKAGRLSPGNEEIREELAKLDRAVKQFRLVERSRYGKMFWKAADTESDKKKESKSKEAEESKKFLREKLSSFVSDSSMTEIVIPSFEGLEECVDEVAEELGLNAKKLSSMRDPPSIKISKPVRRLEGAPPDELL